MPVPCEEQLTRERRVGRGPHCTCPAGIVCCSMLNQRISAASFPPINHRFEPFRNSLFLVDTRCLPREVYHGHACSDYVMRISSCDRPIVYRVGSRLIMESSPWPILIAPGEAVIMSQFAIRKTKENASRKGNRTKRALCGVFRPGANTWGVSSKSRRSCMPYNPNEKKRKRNRRSCFLSRHATERLAE